MCQVQDTCLKRELRYNLMRFVGYGRLSEKFLLTDMGLESGLADAERCCLAVLVACLLDYQFL